MIHLLRLLGVAFLLSGLHLLAARSRMPSELSTLDIAVVRTYLPQAASIAASGSPPLWQVRDANDATIALCCLTSPQADRVIGYAGPNNVLLIMDPAGNVTRAELLHSLDTVDHVERVRASEKFWQQFSGRAMGQVRDEQVDGVSGATLTSLAIAEAIDLRLGGKRPSLKFPPSISIEEARAFYPTAEQVRDEAERDGFVHALDAEGAVLGSIMRTGTLCDDKIGYQGPTELLLALDSADRVTKVKLRSSFDNEPYVRYARMEASFWAKFVGHTLAELSRLDLAAEGVEGVSGATMTSMAAADTVRAAALQHLAQQAKPASDSRSSRSWNWSLGEVATGLIALAVVPWSLSRQRGNRRWRLGWQVIVLVVMVGLSGNLVSMALLAGWTRSGPQVMFAPGLFLLVVIAVGMPALWGRNVYCDHICPHGMLQQWLDRWRRGRPRDRQPLVQIQLPAPESKTDVSSSGEVESSVPASKRLSQPARRWFHAALHLSALVAIGCAIGWILWTIPDQLTFFEPFDAYAWRIGWSVSLAVWIASLLLALKEPMGYCRLACPTGKLLESVRRNRAGRRLRSVDMLWITLAMVVWLKLLFSATP